MCENTMGIDQFRQWRLGVRTFASLFLDAL